MKLFYSVTSPYSRKVLLTAWSLGFRDDVGLILGSSLDPDTDLPAYNPLGKVPALVLETGETVFDSPLIVEYFLKLAGVERSADAIYRQLQVQAAADGIMDAAVNMVMDSRKPDSKPSAFWQDRWEKAIIRSVAYIEETLLAELDSWQFGSIGTACALDYLCFRLSELDWRTAAPKLAVWFDDIIAREDLRETDPRRG